ncbi:unnamed protein product [Rotaria magnacalcarata]
MGLCRRSDEEAIVLNQPWTIHNAHLTNLPSQLEKCRERYSKPPFRKICNTSFEFGCYLSRVSNPLDIQSNTPCINLTQIGDGVEDRYNAYDEKNTFTTKTDNTDMWGFHFRCGSDHRGYVEFCSRLNCTEILCSKYRDKDGSCSNMKDAICHRDDRCKKNARCDGIVDCEDGEDEYWCPSGSLNDQISYRFRKRQILDSHIDNIYLITYPSESMVDVNQQQVSKSNINLKNDSFFKLHSYQCNRVARSRAKTVGQRVTFSEVLKQQFKTQKELYVTPTIAVISVLPQVILTFSFACTPLSDWQRHT